MLMLVLHSQNNHDCKNRKYNEEKSQHPLCPSRKPGQDEPARTICRQSFEKIQGGGTVINKPDCTKYGFRD